MRQDDLWRVSGDERLLARYVTEVQRLLDGLWNEDLVFLKNLETVGVSFEQENCRVEAEREVNGGSE